MSSHSPSHSSHGHASGDSVFTTAKSWFSTKSPSHLNPLSATDAVAHNTVRGVIENTTGWFADVLNPLWAGVKSAGAFVRPSKIKENGFFKNIGKSLTGVVAHTLDSVNNALAGGTVRGLDHAYTHLVTDSVVDISGGTADRVPVVGNFTGNIVKGVNVVPAAPIRFLARLWENTIDRGIDWMKSFAAYSGKGRHLTTAHAVSSSGHGGGHH